MFKDKRFLTIDDSAAIRNYLRTLLTRQGASVDTVGTGQEGLEMCTGDEGYDLILLDLLLPDMTGIDVLQHIRQEDRETTVVIITGFGGVKSAIAAVRHGADAYVEKQDIAAGGDFDTFFFILEQALKHRASLVAQRQLQIEHRRAVEALVEGEERYRTLIENQGEGTSIVDPEEHFVFANPAAHQIFGVPPGGLIGRHLQEFIDAEAFALVRAQTEARQAGKKSVYELQFYRPDGERRHLLVTATAQFDNTGQFIGTFGIFRDITERKRAEEALRELNATLEAKVTARTAEILAEKEKSETILRSVGDAIGMTDLEMRIQYVNEALTTLTGYTAEELLGQSMDILMAEELPEQDRRALQLALAKGEGWRGEMVARRKDGRIYDAAMLMAPVRDVKGQTVGYVSSHQDITRLKDLDRARSQFMTNVSHELRTPVANIKLYAFLLQKGMSAEKSERYLQILVEQAERLEHLVQDMLEMTGLDSGQAVTAWEPISLPIVIGDTVARYQSQAEASGLSLKVKPIPHDLPAVKGDQARLAQALSELVENALIFTPAGGQVTVEAETTKEEGQHWVTIAVRDTGPGISPEEQERLFERFFRGTLAESGHIPGTGLGLSMAQEIMRAHGGRVTVKSQVGEGSTFTLWLQGGPS